MKAKLIGLQNGDVAAAYSPWNFSTRVARFTSAGVPRFVSQFERSENFSLGLVAHPSGTLIANDTYKIVHFDMGGSSLGNIVIPFILDIGKSYGYALMDLIVDDEGVIWRAFLRTEGILEFGFPPQFMWRTFDYNLQPTASPEQFVVTSDASLARIHKDGSLVQMSTDAGNGSNFRLKRVTSTGEPVYVHDFLLTEPEPDFAQLNTNSELAVGGSGTISSISRFNALGELLFTTDVNFEIQSIVHTDRGEVGVVGSDSMGTHAMVFASTGAILHELHCIPVDGCLDEPRVLAERNGAWFATGVSPLGSGSNAAWVARFTEEPALFASGFESQL